MDQSRGNGLGFDAVRLALAYSVLFVHSFAVAEGEAFFQTMWRGPLWPFLCVILPMFFGLSGFLVAGSALRTRSASVFMTFRVLRIAPALSTEITLSAMILGPLLTTATLYDYFTNKRFFAYFGNVIGRLRLELLGVFEHNPTPYVVNGNLWTLKPEFYCYAIMLALMLTGIVYRRGLLTALFVVATVGLGLAHFLYGYLRIPVSVDAYAVLIYSFVMGAVAFHWREYIPIDVRIAAPVAILVYLTIGFDAAALLSCFLVMYLTIYIGVLAIPRIPGLQRKGADYSYGIYLYGYPIQQSLVLLFPELRSWWLLFPLCAVLTTLFAMGSWRWVERPFLDLKRFVGKPAAHPATSGSKGAARWIPSKAAPKRAQTADAGALR
jgi:peptidoglycan/LPS O-acetylase OafA/YrhL